MMARFGGDKEFDVSDATVEVDKLDVVLDVAVDVLRDYAGQPGTTRIERMAKYLVLNFGGEPYSADAIEISAEKVLAARAFAVAILRAVELVEA